MTVNLDIFELTPGEQSSALWLKLKSHLEKRLSDARCRNDFAMTSEQTAALRGQIAELKAFLSLGEPPTLDGMTNGPRQRGS